MEVQKDKDGATLVCYSKTFRESFSIHLKNMPPKLHDKVIGYLNSDKYEATIANTKLIPPGLTLRTEKFNPRYGKQALNEIISGGFYEKENEYSIALHNYIEYDLYYQIKELREHQESIKKGTCTKKTLEYFEALNVDEWFKDFEDIDKVQYTGQNGKTILTRIKEQSTTPNDNHHLGVKPKDIKNYKYQIGKALNLSQSHHEKRTISTDETTVETLKKLSLDLGTLPTGLKKEDSKPSHKK
jgi:hypothetical protein